ncbi:MAG: hypothetical protein ASARMPREDX12_000403 [Alectoria sarmentosa]|nr:MAG: hypothetical protein ASARMPREDX12_000403 [Alectoria sarmentosa]
MSLNSKPRSTLSATNRPPGKHLQGSEMGSSNGHNRSLSDKMRSLHRKKNSNENNPGPKPLASAMAAGSIRKPPRHLDLMEAASHSQGEAVHSRRNDGQHREVGTGKENKGISVKQMRPSNNMDQSYRSIAYNQYLSQAFGLQGDEKPRPAVIQRLRAPELSEARPDSEMSAMTGDSMEVNFHMDPIAAPSAKDRRPKIQVTIPGKVTKRPHSSSHLATQVNRQKSHRRSRSLQTQVSPSSSTTHQQNAGDVPARLSVVSPLSVVEMPKPRRPFSAFSLEDMTSDTPRNAPSLEKLARSDSSDDTGELDDRSSNYSGRSSSSSLVGDTAVHGQSHNRGQSIAFSVYSPAAAGVFDGAPLALKNNRLRSFKSSTSLSTVDMNKPLPPEPGAEVAPLNFAYSRPGSMKGKRKVPSPLTFSRSSMYETPSQFPSRRSSLRSKYTPADLDALDAAFTNTSPNMQAGFGYQLEPSLSQAEADLEAHLGTINEEPTMQHPNMMPVAHDPLQISRGPNTMVPSRHAPHPPSSLKLSDGSISSRKRFQKKTSTHVAMQMRGDSSKWDSDDSSRSGLRRRISAPVVGSTAKADKILGKSATLMAGESSSESNWSSSESPQTNYDGDSSSPTTSREDSSTPETDVSSVPDHAYEEVRARLELLSPKNNHDSEQFAAFDPHPTEYAETSSSFNRSPQTQTNDVTHNVKLPWTTPESSSNAQAEMTTPAIYLTPVEEFEESQVTIAIGLDAPIDDVDESNIHPLQRRGAQEESPQRRRSMASTVMTERPRSLASIAMSEIPDIYASLPSPGLTIRSRQSIFLEDAERDISADAAEVVLLHILENLDNLQDLFATATVSRGFYRTFKRHELPLMKNALCGMSPAAWELREMSPPYPGLESRDNALPKLLEYSPSLYLQHYMRDMYTMIALKSMILIHCESFLRADTITALAGGETERASQIDDAFWRVWTFCQVFGCGSKREDDIVGQMDWLRGGALAKHQRRTANAAELGADVNRNSVLYSSPPTFGKGNVGGLTAEDLYDMTEIWTCLGVLVRGFQGKRREAREYGIFDKADITAGDIEQEDSVLEEWTYHLLTLAPPIVLDVTSPTSPTAANFAHARSRGYTTWTPPTISRATFLKEAVSRVYQEKMAERHPTSPMPSPKGKVTNPSSPVSKQLVDDVVAARWRCARHAAEIRAKRSDPGFKALPPSEDRPMSEFPAVLEKLDMGNAPPIPTIPSAHSRTPSDLDTSKNFVSALVVPAGPQVRDPVDVAVDRLVGMGFEKRKAAKALAETDTGNSVDFARALEWLVRERKRDVGGLMHSGYRGPAAPTGENDEIASANAESAIREAVGLGLNMGGRAWA